MKKGSAKRVSSLPSNAEFNLGGLYHALRIATVRSSDSLWVPFDKEGKCCKVIHSPTQPQYVETICCLLYTNDELNTSLRIDPSRASRLVSNTAHVPDYFTNKFLADNIFETFSLNVRDRFLSRFTNEQHEFFRQLLVELVQKIPKNSESAYLASNLPPEYSTDLNANNEKYYTAISRIMFAALRQENMKSDPVPLPAWRNKPKDLLHDDPYGLSVEHSSSTALSIKLVEDKSDGCTKEFFSYERALEFIEKNSAFIMKIDCNLGCITLYYKLDTENYTLCRLEEPDYIRASDFIDLHLSEFRPKVSWRNRTLSSMALNGLQTEKWTGYVYKNKENHLVSYLDYKIRTDGDIELGIQLTSETERKKHFATALINYLRFKYKFLNCFIKFLFNLINNIVCLIVNRYSQRKLNLFTQILQHRFHADKHQFFCLFLSYRITFFNVANTLCNQLTFSFFSFIIVRFYKDFFHFIYKCFAADIHHESLVGEFLRGVNLCPPIVCLFYIVFKLLLIDIQFNFFRNKVFAFTVYGFCWIFAQNIQNFLDCHLNSSFLGTIFLIFLSKNVAILRKVFLL